MNAKRKLIIILAVICLAVLLCSVLLACNREEVKYTLTYSAGATDAQGTVPAVKEYKQGEKITLLDSDTFTRSGYKFAKWNDGENDYAAVQEYIMPAKNITMTAIWEKDTQVEEDIPTLTELNSKFYNANNWVYMTNNGGASLDGGDVPFSLADGSIKFHRANQAIELGKTDNGTVSFMLKGTNDWAIWLNSNSIDNRDNNSYRLVYQGNQLGIVVSSVSGNHAAVVSQSTYKVAEWNRIDVVFETVDNVCSIKLYVNGQRASLVRGNIGATEEINVSKNVMKHTQGAGFELGNYAVVKVWEAHNFIQIKPVANKDVADLPIVACIGASITEGAGANNFYTESYPAQLQRRLGANYNVINFGNSGKTVREDLEDENGNSVAWLAQYQWQGVQLIKPDIAILNIGTNDSKTSNDPLSTHDSFKQAYNHLLDQLLTVNSEMDIYICTVPTAYTGIWGISEDNINSIIAPVQREIAEERGFTLIDLYQYSKNKSLLFGDGVHPNTHGYTMFVDIIEEVMKNGTLSQQFLNEIDQKYNDNGKIDNVSASIIEEGGKLYLTVSGDTTMTDGEALRVYVGDGSGADFYYNTTIEGGKFSAKIDLAELKVSTKWYNVRVYCDEYSHRIVLMSHTSYSDGNKFVGDDTQATVHTWNTNWGASFSFTVQENYSTQVTSASITSVEGTLTLTVNGTTNASALTLFVGQKPEDETKSNFRVNFDVTDNTFTVTFDLTRLNNPSDWYNVRLYQPDGSYVVVGREITTDGENALKVDDVFYCDETIITIKSWTDGGVATLSFSVKANDGLSPVIKLTEANLVVDVSAGTAILTVSGSTKGTKSTIHDTTLLYLGNDASKAENFQALVEDADGNWTGSVDIASLPIGEKYEIRIYTRNKEGATYSGYYTLKFGEVKTDGVAVAKDTQYEIADKIITVYDDEATWDPFRIKVVDAYVPEPVVTATSIKYVNGQVIITANTANVTRLDFILQNTATNPVYLQTWENVEIQPDGSVTIVINLSELANAPANVPLNCRMYVNGSSEITKLLPGSLDLSQTYNFGGRRYSLGENAGNIKLQYSILTGLVDASASIEDRDGVPTLIVEGTREGKLASEMQLKLDKTSAPTDALYFDNLANEDNKFRFEVDLRVLLASPNDKTGTSTQGYFIRLWTGHVDAHDDVAEVVGSKIDDIHAVWAQEKVDQKVVIGGCTYVFYRNSTQDFTRTLGIAKYDTVLED